MCIRDSLHYYKLQKPFHEPQIMQLMKRFLKFVVMEMKEKWLRLLTNDEVFSIEERYRKLPFAGYLGDLECAGWAWNM